MATETPLPVDQPDEPRPARRKWRVWAVVLAVVMMATLATLYLAGNAKHEADISRAENNFRQIGIAVHSFAASTQKLPGDVLAPDGRPLLSWRVLLLLSLDEEQVYREINLKEPWDSEHNRQFIERMPKVYAPVRKPAAPGETYVCRFAGKGTTLVDGRGISPDVIKDGMGSTFFAVESARPVIWTKPDDLPFDPNGPLPELGHDFDDVFLALMCDGSVLRLRKDCDPAELRKAVTRNGGERFDLDLLKAPRGRW